MAAVSCAEFPREDVDLFYRILFWNHYRFLEVDKHDRVLSMPETESYTFLRRTGQLSDLACLISRDLFLKYKYRHDYAEDLDLGIRLIKDGYKIAFLNSVQIIHSHNRSFYYFLKRAYVDSLFLTRIFPDYPVPAVNEERLLKEILASDSVISFIHEEVSKIKTAVGVEELFSIVERGLRSFDYFKGAQSSSHAGSLPPTTALSLSWRNSRISALPQVRLHMKVFSFMPF